MKHAVALRCALLWCLGGTGTLVVVTPFAGAQACLHNLQTGGSWCDSDQTWECSVPADALEVNVVEHCIHPHDPAASETYENATFAIRNAIIEGNSTGRPVVLPEGTYEVCAPSGGDRDAIEVPSNTTIRGAGIGKTTLQLVAGPPSLDDLDHFSARANILAGTAVSNVTVSNLTIRGNFSPVNGEDCSGQHGVAFRDGASNLTLRDMEIRNVPSYGIAFQQNPKDLDGDGVEDECGDTVFDYHDIHLSNITIAETGADGIDFKNRCFGNHDISLHDITIRRPGLGILIGNVDKKAERKAGIDVRGPMRLSSIRVEGLGWNHSGVRFHIGEAGITKNGTGGHRSSLIGFHISGDDSLCQQYLGADGECPVEPFEPVGLQMFGRNVAVANGLIDDVDIGVNVRRPCEQSSNPEVTPENDCSLGIDQRGNARISNVTVSGADRGFFVRPGIRGVRFLNCSAFDSTFEGFVLEGIQGTMMGCTVRCNCSGGVLIKEVPDDDVESIDTLLLGNDLRNSLDCTSCGSGTGPNVELDGAVATRARNNLGYCDLLTDPDYAGGACWESAP